MKRLKNEMKRLIKEKEDFEKKLKNRINSDTIKIDNKDNKDNKLLKEKINLLKKEIEQKNNDNKKNSKK